MKRELARSPPLWYKKIIRQMKNFSHSLALEPTAGRCAFTFFMIKIVPDTFRRAFGARG